MPCPKTILLLREIFIAERSAWNLAEVCAATSCHLLHRILDLLGSSADASECEEDCGWFERRNVDKAVDEKRKGREQCGLAWKRKRL